MVSGVFLKPDFTVHNLTDNKAGTLRYVVTQLAPTPVANGKGVILSVQFRGKHRDTSTKLTISLAVLADRHGNKQVITAQGADLVIVRPKSPMFTPTALPAAYLIPAVPTWSPPTSIPAIKQPTAQPSPAASQAAPAALPGVEVAWNTHAWVPEMDPEISGRILRYVSVGGFFGAIFLFGLLIWLLAVKRRKARNARTK